MADHYRQFSELIEAITPQERAWIRQVLDCQDDVSTVLKESGIRASAVEPDGWPGFQWQLEDHEPDLWLYSEDSGNVEHVGEFVRAFLARFRPKACWSMTWSDSCSKPRVGEFTGAGLFVTAKNVRFFCAADAVQRMHKRFARVKSSNPKH
jgi:hypothetical protein